MEMRQTQLQSALDHAHQEMFDYKTKQDDVTSARSSEVDILNQDLERANEVISSRLLSPGSSLSLTSSSSEHRMPNVSWTNYANNWSSCKARRPRPPRCTSPMTWSTRKRTNGESGRNWSWNWRRKSERSRLWSSTRRNCNRPWSRWKRHLSLR